MGVERAEFAKLRMDHELDDLDRGLIGLLQEDGRMAFSEIGKRLGVSANTVRARFNLLSDRGMVRVLAIPETKCFDLNFHAVVALRLERGSIDRVADKLVQRPEIGWIGILLTGFDLMFELSLEGNAAFGRYKKALLAELPDIVDIETFLLSEVPKFHYALQQSVKTRSAG